MLECGTNFKGTMSDICRHCNTINNENHRLNECNFLNDATQRQRCNFSDVYSNDEAILTKIMKQIESVSLTLIPEIH